MVKYSFLVHHREYDDFLRDIQQLGVLDVVDRKAEPTRETIDQIQQLRQCERTIKFLNTKLQPDSKAEIKELPENIFQHILDLQIEQDFSKVKAESLLKTYNQAKPWGLFSSELIRNLAQEGIFVRFFVVSEKKFKPEWEKQFNLEIISHADGHTYFVIVQNDHTPVEVEADEMKLPERSASDIQHEREALQKRVKEIEQYFVENASTFLPKLEEIKNNLENRISFSEVVQNTGKEADHHLMILEGWVPVDNKETFENYLNQSGHFFFTEKPTPDQNVPVLLKNNRFARLFEPIGKLYALPVYSELDLTAFFAPWFMMFFGFCMADVGYGIVLIIASIVLRRFVSKEIKPILNLGVFLGSATIFFGFVSGTLMGFDMETIKAFDPVKFVMLNDKELFYLALAIGMVQILFGLGIQAYAKIRQFGFQYGLSTIGIILGTLAVLDLTLLKALGQISMYLVYLSLALIVFWSDPNLGIFGRLGKGVWDLYGIITGIFGDVLSYIRLFALGASSGILGFVINSISLPLLDSIPVLGPILFILVMIVGHGANLMLAGLGSFVHPMRLTFVEFYKNAGFAGGGKAYKPFRKNEN
jgi:V/A-type H+-transporting ATPase subunit I